MATTQYFLGSSLNSVVSMDLDTSWAAKSLDTALYFQEKTNKARFQQKQLQEKEQKLLALYEEQARQGYQRVVPGGGKVRQLFQERRGGWDRSHPLEPIPDNRRERGTSLDRGLNTAWKQPLRRARSQVRRDLYDDLPSSRNNDNAPLDQLVFKYNTPLFGDENDYLSRVNDLESSRIFRKLPNIGGATLSDSTDRFKTYIATKQAPVTMAPAKEQKVQTRITDVGSITKAMARMSPPSKKPEVKPVVATPNTKLRSSITPPSITVKQRNFAIPTPTPTTGTRAPPKSTESNNSESKMNKGAVPKAGARTASGGVRAPSGARTGVREPLAGVRSDLVTCKICNRNFAPDRIQAHTEICTKTSRKKRKPFDPSKQRVKGTELESFSVKKRPSQPPPNLAKTNWRKKHEEFIANIRAAKEAQAYVAKGGKLSDLPPPPPMDTSDLIPCPHCKRKFNQAAADRHIPKCANMLHNKPKPGPPAKGRILKK